MKELLEVSKIVKEVLIEKPHTRNSDSLLYLVVLDRVGRAKYPDFDITSLTVPYFLRNMDYLGLPPFETVRRTRAKIQAQCPELQGNEKVKQKRVELEKEYRKFAKS